MRGFGRLRHDTDLQKTNPNPTSQAPPPPPADCRASRLLAHAPSDSSDEGAVEGPGSGGGFLWRASCPRLGDTPQYYCPDPLVFQVKPRSLGSCTQGLQRTCRVQEHRGVGTLRHGLLWPSAPGSRAGRTAEGEGLLLPPASASGLASSLAGLSAWGTRGPSWSFPSPAASLYCPQPGPQGAKGEVGPASSVGAAFSSLLSWEQKSSPSKAAARSFPEVRSHPEGAWPPVRP